MSGVENWTETEQQIPRSTSVKSFDSTVSFTSDDLNEDKVYEKAPWDVYGEATGLGRVKVAQAGDALPITTGYKAKKDGTAQVGVKFR